MLVGGQAQADPSGPRGTRPGFAGIAAPGRCRHIEHHDCFQDADTGTTYAAARLIYEEPCRPMILPMTALDLAPIACD